MPLVIPQSHRRGVSRHQTAECDTCSSITDPQAEDVKAARKAAALPRAEYRSWQDTPELLPEHSHRCPRCGQFEGCTDDECRMEPDGHYPAAECMACLDHPLA